MIAGRDMADEHAFDFRPYTASDFEVVADLWTRVNRELAPAGMETLFEQYIATTIEGELSRLLDIFSVARRNAFWVVEPVDGSRRIVGTFGIECHNSDTTELRRIYIDAGWRGRGLAQRMLRTAEDMARELGFSRMIVSTADVEIELDFSDRSWEAIFQDIIRRSPVLRYVTAVSAFTCSRMRPDGWGGMAVLITPSAVMGKSTGDIIEDFLNEAVPDWAIETTKPSPMIAR